MDRTALERKPVGDLREIAKQLELTGVGRLRKADLIDAIIGHVAADDADAAEEQLPLDEAPVGGAEAADAEVEDAASDEGDDADAGRTRARDELIERRRARNRGEQPAPATAPTPSPSAERPSRPSDERPSRPRDERSTGADVDSDTGDSDDDQDGRDSGGRGRDEDADRNRARGRNRRTRGGKGDLEELEEREGVLDLLPEGYGFLRTTGYVAGPKDVYVSQSYVRRFNLRRGDMLGGPVRFNKGNDKFPALARLETCEGEVVENEHDSLLRGREAFDDTTAIFPDERLRLTTEGGPDAMRVLDLLAPIGKGQRALVLGPPNAGKTTLLVQIAQAIEVNAPDVHVMALLVDERPEEITELERSTRCELISSTVDSAAEDHTAIAELAIERAKRLVERGADVVVLLDSLTRLGRAYNVAVPASGHVLEGGVDVTAVYPPKRLLGAARNVEGGGSLTIVATALTDTDSTTDAVILDEFKGAGNMEVRLDGDLARRRVFPAIDVTSTGTRREELLLDPDEVERVWSLRREVADLPPDGAVARLLAAVNER